MPDTGESTTYGQLCADLRAQLDDTGTGPSRPMRWTDERLRAFLRMGVTALEKVRPAVRYRGMRLAERPATFAETDPVLLDRRFHEAVVEYACFKALQMDENDPSPASRSQAHLKRFQELART